MNAELKQELIDWGVNWEEVKERLVGNEDLVEKFILKFLKDPSMERLQNGLESQDAEEAFQGAHALKGVASNLAMEGNGFLANVKEITEILRPGTIDSAKEVYDKIRPKYDELISILKKYAE